MQVQWNNPQDPSKGFEYLFLSDADYQAINSRSLNLVVKGNPITAHGMLNPKP